jgi:hypothetical protein
MVEQLAWNVAARHKCNDPVVGPDPPCGRQHALDYSDVDSDRRMLHRGAWVSGFAVRKVNEVDCHAFGALRNRQTFRKFLLFLLISTQT